MKGDPLTGSACGCKRGIERDNCPNCEGTGKAIDWRKFHADKKAKEWSGRAGSWAWTYLRDRETATAEDSKV